MSLYVQGGVVYSSHLKFKNRLKGENTIIYSYGCVETCLILSVLDDDGGEGERADGYPRQS